MTQNILISKVVFCLNKKCSFITSCFYLLFEVTMQYFDSFVYFHIQNKSTCERFESLIATRQDENFCHLEIVLYVLQSQSPNPYYHCYYLHVLFSCFSTDYLLNYAKLLRLINNQRNNEYLEISRQRA